MGLAGIKVTAGHLSFGYPGEAPLFEQFDLEAASGEKVKVVVLYRTDMQKTALAKVLAGLMGPSAGVVLYNDMNLVEVNLDSIDARRSLMLDLHPTLLEGSIENNITLGRSSISYDDVQWALQFVELDEEIDKLPDGLTARVTGHSGQFTLSQTLRLLLARASHRDTTLCLDRRRHPAQHYSVRLSAKSSYGASARRMNPGR